MLQKLKETTPTRVGFFLLAVIFFWLKTYLAYHLEFSLGVEGIYQHFLLFLNPLASSLLLFSLSFWFSDAKRGYRALFVIYFLNSLLLFANILYYREFSDFITIKAVLSATTTTKSIGASIFQMFHLQDILYWIDFFLLIWLFRKRKTTVQAGAPLKKRMAIGTLALSVVIFLVNLGLAEIDRPQLLTRTFDRNYIVKYLGMNVYTIYDGIQTAQANAVRASADSSDMAPVLDYVDDHYAAPTEDYFGQTEGRNVVFIHLESMQQFLIDLSLTEENGVTSEVTPFLNQLYHSPDSYSFSNFFHQTSQGKTSDAELLIDNSLFGLPQGSAFTQVGADNTFHSTPQILKDKGYTSAVFHGNVGSFWDRDNVYKSFGYDYFFSSETSYTLNEENSLEYGLKDKLFFQESVQYLEQMQQPFYTKFITVSNHFPFPPDELNTVFDIPDTEDETINGFFNTVHYADESLEEFFQYMKDSGLYENTIFVLYGDHYGISNSRNKTLAPLLDKDPETWNDYENTMLQRVPLIIHAPGIGTGGINDTYGGQVDVMPTVLHLLGIDTQSYIQMGQDLLSPDRDNLVVLRNGNVISPIYTALGNNLYDTATGNPIYLDPEMESPIAAKVQELKEAGQMQLNMSDQVVNGDLLRFYSPPNFTPADKSLHNYLDSPAKLLEDFQSSGEEGTSLLQENNGESTVPLYQTDAPEFPGNQPASVEEGTEESSELPTEPVEETEE
ncbi:LTA synthase family protein [Jeotgalibaca caeni]|uniref:LTA synthase family protein n=1 Tax=Jeotgalibaca caeni TaxID=3028623 RepID=UPI00237E2671|nr:LTA synthase family protein [Jeotgalibaca caeni]MDE1547705.1 LTA synthase family protein [Jeotgalibaca caeni]